MAKPELERNAEPSVLDRLVDEERGILADGARSRAESVRFVMDCVRRDLEMLLNTRRTITPVPDAFPEVATSLFRYGLADLTSLSRDAMETRTRLARQVEEAIALFEPRLAGVKVSVAPNDRSQFGELRFVIEGMLKLEPTPERVTFDTVLDTGRGQVAVRGGADA